MRKELILTGGPSSSASFSNSNSNQSLTIKQQQQQLPIYACRMRFLQEAKRLDTLLLMGETGSGKTTQIPQFLLSLGMKGVIAVTQPRRVAAITVAKRVAQEMQCKLGEQVGFTVRFEDCTSPNTKIKFVTDGTLLREAISDRLLKNYSVIILDEAHERTINTDVLFGLVKEAQRQRNLKNLPTLKIIVMSATMDIDHFSKYFGVKGMYIEGKTYPVKVMHAKETQTDYVHACLVTLFQIHREAPANHDVLIFLTGQEEIDAMAQQIRLLAKSADRTYPNIRVFPLYSQLPQNKQIECFMTMPQNSRKYVIDSGFVKRRVYDPNTGMDSLKVVRISQAQSWQRCGRAGRDAEGSCYRTYTTAEMESFDEMPKPEILRSNIYSTVLQLLSLGVNCKNFDFLDKPSPESVDMAYKQLHLLGAIKSPNFPELTDLGKQMAKFPLDPKYSKLLITSQEFGCLEEILSLVAVLSGENIFISQTEKREQAALAHAKFESKYAWCHDNFLNTRNLLYARDVRNQLKEICVKLGLKIGSCGTNLDLVRKCLLSGLFSNIAELQRDNFYLTLSSRQRAKIHPSSVLSGKSRPALIIFTEIVATDRNFLRTVTAIEPEWVEEVVPNYPFLSRLRQSNSFNFKT
uniref:RNA helicase n=1 Tax=Megaselia scalaris TaxID=36166 RepID=T1GNP9_MEGSC